MGLIEGGRTGKYLRGRPELDVSGGDDEEEAIDDFEVDDLLGRRADALLQGDDLRPSVRHIHIRSVYARARSEKPKNGDLRGRGEGTRLPESGILFTLETRERALQMRSGCGDFVSG